MPGMFEITVDGSFCAAHHLAAHPGPCARVHGHNFAVTATLEAHDTGGTGMVLDFCLVKQTLDVVLDELDHKDLNALPDFKDVPPTAEMLARHIFNRLKAGLGDSSARPTKVTVRETKDFAASYRE